MSQGSRHPFRVVWSLPALVCALLAVPAWAQDGPGLDLPPEMQSMAREMEFDEPTRIAGRLLTFDAYDDAIWVEWMEVFADGRWRAVLPDRQFVLYPPHREMMQMLRAMPKGTVLRMTVQKGADGRRRIVALEGT
jgi:hypothetical protein